VRLPNLFNFTINGNRYGCTMRERSICVNLGRVTERFELYEAALESAFAKVTEWKPDLIIYQAGADPHINDPLGSLGLTTEQLLRRDQKVFRFCRETKRPMFFVLAGGYQEPIEEKLVPLHLNTFRAAFEIYPGNPVLPTPSQTLS